jgi:mRNA interferase MazF
MSERNDYRLGIWLIQFDPSVGTEIRKTRPRMVISGDIFNTGRSKVTVLPLTSVKLNQNISTKITPALVQISPSKQNGLSVESLLFA